MKKLNYIKTILLAILAGTCLLAGIGSYAVAENESAAIEDTERAAEELAAAAEAAKEAAEELQEASQSASNLVAPLEALTDENHVNEFIYLAAIFALAIFVGYYVVWSVTAALHTPLMAVTNAISSVVIVGALIAVGADVAQSAAGSWSRGFGIVAVALASVNIFGGFMVTQRMLAMYKKKEKKAA